MGYCRVKPQRMKNIFVEWSKIDVIILDDLYNINTAIELLDR